MKKRDKNRKEKRKNRGIDESLPVKKKNIIARHKLLFLLCLLAFIVLVVLFYIFFSLIIGSNDPYGERLKGINSVKISSKEKKEVESFLSGKEDVSSSLVRVQGKIIYIHITAKDTVSLDAAKNIADESLSKFSDDEKKFYDFGFILRQEKEDGFYATGTKNSNSDHIVWIKG